MMERRVELKICATCTLAGCNAHVMLLRNFNRLVDLSSRGQIIVDARYVQCVIFLLNFIPSLTRLSSPTVLVRNLVPT